MLCAVDKTLDVCPMSIEQQKRYTYTKENQSIITLEICIENVMAEKHR